MNTKKNYPSILQSFGIVGIIVLCSILFSPIMFFSGHISKELSFFLYYIAVFGLSFLLIYAMKRKVTVEKTFYMSFWNCKIIFFIIVASIALVYGVVSPIIELIPMPEFIKKALEEFGSMNGIFGFFSVVIAAPVFEELIFRGIMLDGLLKRYSPIKSILVSAIMFGIVHLNPWQFVVAFLVGILSGWIYYMTKSLTLSIIIHATVNLNSFLSMYFFDESQKEMSLQEFYGGVINYALVILGSLTILSLAVFILKKEFDKSFVENAVSNANINEIGE